MTCDQAKDLISAYQDGELPAERQMEMDRHLEGCAACSASLGRNLRLSEAIRSQVPAYAAPPALAAKTPTPSLAWRPFAAGLTAGLAAAAAIFWFTIRTPRDLAAELVGDHVRSLMATHLIDVASSDRHTVKPWFLGKVDFAPTVPDLDASGYPLLGGRLDYVAGHPVAALVYGKQKHIINVFVMPEREAASSEVNGYNIVHWRLGDLDYWAVSDVPREDLAAFEKAFRAP